MIRRMSKFILCLTVIFFFLVKTSLATVINKIDIVGNKRVAKETIILFGKIEKNTDLTNEDLDSILKNLYETTFFENISLKIKNDVLVITVIENPIIQNVSIIGIPAKKIKEKLLEIVKLKNTTSFVENFAKNDYRLIKNYLKTLGYYFVDVKSSIKQNTNNTIDLVIQYQIRSKSFNW